MAAADCICSGSGLWQLVASWFSWPVAGTHCIIFGLLGFTVTAKGIFDHKKWKWNIPWFYLENF